MSSEPLTQNLHENQLQFMNACSSQVVERDRPQKYQNISLYGEDNELY
jgi:hypothetical protein